MSINHLEHHAFFSCRCFLVNSADRIIRVYESREVLTCGKDGEPEPIQKLQDLVNKSVCLCGCLCVSLSLSVCVSVAVCMCVCG